MQAELTDRGVVKLRSLSWRWLRRRLIARVECFQDGLVQRNRMLRILLKSGRAYFCGRQHASG